MVSNRSMPRCTVIPELAYPNVVAAGDWLCDVFGFSVRLRIANHRMQLNVGEGAVVLTAQATADRPLENAHAVMVRVEDVDGHHAHAVARGARISAIAGGLSIRRAAIHRRRSRWPLLDVLAVDRRREPRGLGRRGRETIGGTSYRSRSPSTSTTSYWARRRQTFRRCLRQRCRDSTCLDTNGNSVGTLELLVLRRSDAWRPPRLQHRAPHRAGVGATMRISQG